MLISFHHSNERNLINLKDFYHTTNDIDSQIKVIKRHRFSSLSNITFLTTNEVRDIITILTSSVKHLDCSESNILSKLSQTKRDIIGQALKGLFTLPFVNFMLYLYIYSLF